MDPLENSPINHPHLTYGVVEPLFNEQAKRSETRYLAIACCCAVVIGIAAAATCLTVNLVFLSAIPMVAYSYTARDGSTHHSRRPALGFEDQYSGHAVGASMGTILGGAAIGAIAFGIGYVITKVKIERLGRRIQQIIAGHDPEKRLSGKNVINVLKLADEQTRNELLLKMDLAQLAAATHALGLAAMQKWYNALPRPLTLRQAFMQDLTSLFTGDQNPSILLDKLVEFDRVSNIASMNDDISFRNEFFKLLRTLPDKNARLLLAFKWFQLAAQPQNEEDQHTLQLNNSPANIIKINDKLLATCSTVLSAAVEPEPSKPREQEVEITVNNADKLTWLLRMLKRPEDYIDEDEHLGNNNNRLKEIFLCAYQYLDKFSDCLQLAFSKKELKALTDAGVFDNCMAARKKKMNL